MQQRHQDREQYFKELANTSREYYVEYLKTVMDFSSQTRVLEIGCGEGGNLLPFAELGCQVTGIDLSETRVNQAREFFAKAGAKGTFISQNFVTAEKPGKEEDRYDLVLVHDVIEHIEPEYKHDFMSNIHPFLKEGGILFFGFPAWQMPFGGHQQISKGFVAKLPFVHLLPNLLYVGLLKMCGNNESCINELLSIKRSKMPVERFEKLCRECGYNIVESTFWFINPHYEQKFGLKPRKLNSLLAKIKYVRNFYTTSAFYLMR